MEKLEILRIFKKAKKENKAVEKFALDYIIDHSDRLMMINRNLDFWPYYRLQTFGAKLIDCQY